MIFASPYWDDRTKLSLLARWIIFHSYLYYELDKPVVQDEMFDNNCRQFMQIAKQNKQALKQHRYFYVMYDFDGSTGFDLFKRLNKEDKELIKLDAKILLRGKDGR